MGQSRSKHKTIVHRQRSQSIYMHDDNQCNCKTMLLYGYIHEIDKTERLSYIVPTEIFNICKLYYNTLCPNQYFPTFRHNIENELGTDESLKWALQLNDVVNQVMTMGDTTKVSLFDKFDIKHNERLHCRDSLPQLIHALITFHIKLQDRTAKIPKFSQLSNLTQSISKHIENEIYNEYISKQDFRYNIVGYLRQFADNIKPKWMNPSYSQFFLNIAKILAAFPIDFKIPIYKYFYWADADDEIYIKCIITEVINRYHKVNLILFIYIYSYNYNICMMLNDI